MSEVKANVTGTVLKVLVKVGDKVSVDQDLLSVESMKMEMIIPSTHAGVIKEIKVNTDDFIQEGQVVAVLS